MSFLKRLFGGGKSNAVSEAAPAANAEEYHGYRLVPAPQKEGGQFRLAGRIEREVDGEPRVHQLIRADQFTSADEAVAAFFRKARQVIDEQGERIFN